MKIAQYLQANNITQTAFAEKIGVTQASMNRYVRGERTPSAGKMNAIHMATKGAVTLSDWVKDDLSQPQVEKVA